jgi:hypothetical protein
MSAVSRHLVQYERSMGRRRQVRTAGSLERITAATTAGSDERHVVDPSGPAQPGSALKVIAERYRVAASVGHCEDHVRRLDDRGHRLALLEAELAGRLDGDRGDDALSVDVEFDVRDRRALR